MNLRTPHCARRRLRALAGHRLLLLASAVLPLQARAETGKLADQFQSPPTEASPLVWYHWVGDHISKEGITKDLEAMREAGIGGGAVFHVGSTTPAKRRVPFFEGEWRDAMKHLFQEADRNDLQFGMHNCPGWSAAGGPWVPVEESQKDLDWTETIVDGPGPMITPLPRPPAKLDYYRDVGVFAYPEPRGGGDQFQRHAAAVELKSGSATLDATAVAGKSSGPGIKVHPAEPLVLTFPEPVTVCSLGIRTRGGAGKASKILLSIPDGSGGWREVGGVEYAANSPQLTKTTNFPPVTSNRFRLEFSAEYKPLPEIAVGRIALMGSPLVPDPEWKAHFASRTARSAPTWIEENESNRRGDPEVTLPDGVPPPPAADQILDLTDKLRPDGTLDWEIPPGTWTILRFGMTASGKAPHPAVVKGLEVDKLDAKAMRAHLENYLGVIANDAGPLAGKRFSFSLIDSHEQGFQNWTGDLPEKFHRRRGYEIGPRMVCLAGRPVSTLPESERFLWDFRRTVMDLWADEYFGTFTDFLHKRGMSAYAEAYGGEVFDSSQCNGRVDAPMTEMWWNEPKSGQAASPANITYGQAAHAANTYGKRLVAVEGFSTSPGEAGWRNHPAAMRRLADSMFLSGINQIHFHTCPLQAYDTAPGITLFVWGSQFGRLNSWWPLSQDWHHYLARCQYLLRQGHSVSDFARHLGEEAPESPWLPNTTPTGFRSDNMNTEVILDSLAVRDGRLTLPHGAEYQALVIETRVMRVELARKLAALVEAGATIIGPKPLRSPSLADGPDADREIQEIAENVWGPCDGVTVTEHKYGKGRVIWTSNPSPAAGLGSPPDFQSEATPLGWLHRKADGLDLYFLVNGSQPFSGSCLFRVAGRTPELWDPVTGKITRPRTFEPTADGRTRVTIDMPPEGSLFVVFRENSPEGLPTALDPRTLHPVLTLPGPWEVEFQAGRGAPATARFDHLASWTGNANPGIKYFSGIATYRTTFDVPPEITRQPVFLDLGKVADVARVTLNDSRMGGVWATPARVDISGGLRLGRNTLVIEVANRWINRLIGDEQFPDDVQFRRDASFGATGYTVEKLPEWFPDLSIRPRKERIGFPFYKHYTKDSPPVPAGLLGPVTLQTVSQP